MTLTRRDCLASAATAPALASADVSAASSPNATETAWQANRAANAKLLETDRAELEIRRRYEREGTVLPDEPRYPSPFGSGYFFSVKEFDEHVATDVVMRGCFGEDCRRAREAQMAREREALIRSLAEQQKLLEDAGIAELTRQYKEAVRVMDSTEAAILECHGRTIEDARRKLVVLSVHTSEAPIRDALKAVIAQLTAISGQHSS